MQERPIFEYSDYRLYLQDYVSDRRNKNPRWSLGAWSRKLGLKSPSTLTMILNGQRNPSPALSHRLSQSLKLNTEAREYFEDLISVRRLESEPRLKIHLLERLAGKCRGTFRLLDPQAFFAISHWYCYAVREMVNLVDFQEDPSWISKRLLLPVSPARVKKTLNALLSLNLLERGDTGRLRYSSGSIQTYTDVEDEGLKRFHEQVLDNAKAAVRTIGPADREISGMTFCMNAEQMPRAKLLIRDFQKKMVQEFETSSGNSVVQLEVGFFPLTAKGQRDE